MSFCAGIEQSKHWGVMALQSQQGKKLVDFVMENAKRRKELGSLLSSIDDALEELLVQEFW